MNSTLTAEELVAYAQGLNSISAKQLERLKKLAPHLNADELGDLKATLEKNQKILDDVAAKEAEYFADKSRKNREAAEALQQVSENKNADQLLSTL